MLFGSTNKAATVKIAKDLKSLQEDPVEGIYCEFLSESNVFEWKIYFEGPEGTPYQGGVFEARMYFPQDYPMSPPTLYVISEFWHPNVFKDGKVCISILHSPGNDPLSGELPEERWLPTQTVATIMLSFQSMLSDPNLSSPANIDASVMWRDNRKTFNEKVAKLVEQANLRVPKYIVIPHPDTNPEEKAKRLDKMKRLEDLNNFSFVGNMEDSDDIGSHDIEADGDEFDDEDTIEIEVKEDKNIISFESDCPVCKIKMNSNNKGVIICPTCQRQYTGEEYLCGRKCYILDCGEIRPSGNCKNPIHASNNWKCEKNTHKDDPNGEDNFLESTML